MDDYHSDLKKRWNEMDVFNQMANIGAEVGRTIRWRRKNETQFKNSFFRVLDLIDFSIADPKNLNGMKEFLYVREMLCDYFWGENEFKSSDDAWQKYFFPFNVAAAKMSGR